MKKIALVTGASSGIGRNAALSLATADFTVIATSRRLDVLKETSAMSSEGIDCIVSDVTDTTSVDSLFKEIKERYGKGYHLNIMSISGNYIDFPKYKKLVH